MGTWENELKPVPVEGRGELYPGAAHTDSETEDGSPAGAGPAVGLPLPSADRLN